MNEDDKASNASASTVEPCNLALQSFPVLEVGESCPTYARITRGGAAAGDIVSQDEMQKLQRELELLVQSTTYRIKRMTEEYQKSDTFVKQNRDFAISQVVGSAGSSAAQSTIKLDLKKIKGDGPEPKQKKKKVKEGSPQAKRKRASAVGDQSESDYAPGRDDASSIADGKDSAPSTKLKKKQRRDSDFDKVKAETASTAAESAEPAKVKPSQQIPIATFWNMVDAYFKPITPEDIQVLEDSLDDDFNHDPEPYLIPPLGRPYEQVWAEEDKASAHLNSVAKSKKKKGNSTDVEDDSGISPEMYCGPLTERLLAALLEEDVIFEDIKLPEDPNSTDGGTSLKPPSKEELYSIEDRIKRELRFLGLLEDEVALSDTEEDEVSIELRRLQEELRRVHAINKNRRAIVKEKAIDQLAYQEYRLVLDEVEKQIEGVFTRRQKLISKKKRKSGASAIPPPDGVHPLLERRAQLIQEFKPIFPPDIMKIPSESVFNEDENAAAWLREVSLTPPPVAVVLKSAVPSVVASPAEKPQTISEAKLENPAASKSAPPLAEEAPPQPTSQQKGAKSTPSATSASAKPRKKYTKKKKADKTTGDGKTPAATTGESSTTGPQSAASAAAKEKKPRPKKEKKKATKETDVESVLSQSQAGAGDVGLVEMLEAGDGGVLPDWMYPEGS